MYASATEMPQVIGVQAKGWAIEKSGMI